MKKIILSIDGMTCSACSNGLEKYLNKQKGIEDAFVNLVMASATVMYDESKIEIQDIEEYVKQAGFKSLGEFKEIKIEEKNKKSRNILIVYTILAVILMYISMGGMVNLPSIPILDINLHPRNYTICLFIFTIIFIFYGFDILKNGYKNLIHKTPNMDTLVSIGVLSGFLYSIYNMILVINGDTMAVHHLYFEASSMVIYFLKLGRYLEGMSKNKTKEAIQKLVQITPEYATLKTDDGEKTVTIDEIKRGDILISKPGDRVAVDGVILSGNAHLDETFITGESKPVKKETGEHVIAGSLNYDGYIEYRAEKIGRDSTISEIIKLVIEATNTKAPISKIADKVSSYFVPIVITVAVITFIAYLILGLGFPNAIITFVTILVVACPCSLGLATPLAIVVSEGKCATNGILVKKSEILENVQKVNTIVFDKTGTLTYGKLKIAKICNYSDSKDDEILQIVGSLEIKSSHPIAKAFTDYLNENKIKKLEVQNFENIVGHGIVGIIDNNKYILGNSKILEKYNIKNAYNKDELELSKAGNSIVYVIKN